jgi:hypothetical protein
LRRATFFAGTRFLVLARLRAGVFAFRAVFLPVVFRRVVFFFATPPPGYAPRRMRS